MPVTVAALIAAHRGGWRPLTRPQARQAVEDAELILQHFAGRQTVPELALQHWFRTERGVKRLHRRRLDLAIEAAGGTLSDGLVRLPEPEPELPLKPRINPEPLLGEPGRGYEEEANGYDVPKRTKRARPVEKPLRQRIREWIDAAPEGATIGDGAKAFGLTPSAWLAARDGRDERSA